MTHRYTPGTRTAAIADALLADPSLATAALARTLHCDPPLVSRTRSELIAAGLLPNTRPNTRKDADTITALQTALLDGHYHGRRQYHARRRLLRLLWLRRTEGTAL